MLIEIQRVAGKLGLIIKLKLLLFSSSTRGSEWE